MTSIQRHNTDRAPAPIGPYSQASIHNGLLYVSGQIPLLTTTNQMLEGSIEEQAELVFRNLIHIVESAGSSADKIIKNTLFIKSMDDFIAINGVYQRFFGASKPARSCVEVSRLPKDAGIEMESIVAL